MAAIIDPSSVKKYVESLYIIGSLRNRDNVVDVANELRGTLDIECFDDWISPGPEADDHWKTYEEKRGHTYSKALDGYAAQHVYEFDKYHLDRCDGAVLVYPAGRSCGIEFGYVIGSGKPGWILLDNPDRWDVMVQFANGWTHTTAELAEMIGEYNASDYTV